MSADKLTAPTLRTLAAVGALVLLALCLRSAFGIEHPATPVLTGLTAAIALALAQASFTGRMPKLQDFIVDAVAVTLIAMARDPNVPIWQIPSQWSELLRLSTPGASIAAAIYIAGALGMPMREDRHLALHESISLFLLPFVFNVLLLIGARGLLQQLGGWASLGLLPAAAAIVLGRFLVLFAFVELLIGALSFFITGRLSRNLRLHRLLAGASIHAVLSVEIASVPQLFGHAPILIEGAIAIVCAALAQSGLWAFIYITTGVAIEAVAGRPPTVTAALLHWNKGIRKGAVFGALFATLAIVWGFALWLAPHLPRGMGAIAVLAIAAGALTFPFFATLVGSADETPPFFGRLKNNYQTPRAYMRGIVCGFGLFLAIFCHLPDQGGWARFGLGFAIGAFAYGGIDFLSDALLVVRGERHQFATWRLYAATMLMGGIIGGALGWYFDHPQLNVVADKLREYADLSFAASGRPAADYVIYPLFSKWGMMNLGQVGGGISLFFTESLSGVINWSLAAPLFGINYVLLEALLEKNLRPLRQLFSQGGLDGLVVQTVRVLRWGLWMAPVIFTFLKASPDPAWYNQDGAVRTIVATVHSLTMSDHDFRIWSLVIFTGVLAYDWLRVLIWFDHMGVRVATLVNLTFVGGDRLDRVAARAVGYAAPTRFIPESIRRFATWMPLLIPFYIPRGGEWDIAWSGAEKLQTHAMPPEISGLIGDYILAGLWCGVVALFIAKHWTRLRSSPTTLATSVPRSLASGRTQFALSNGSIGVNLLADGRGYRHIYETARAGAPLDLTRRPTDSQQPRGLFFYVRDRESDSVFSLGYEPCHVACSDYRVNEDGPGMLSMRNRHGGIRAEAEIRLAEEDSVEVWKVRLVNLGDHPRRLSLTSFQEIAMSEFPAYVRDRDFHAMHVATWFVRPLNAVLARNRLLRSWGRMADQRMSQEIFFHAVGLPQGAKLLGYEDSRIRFFGEGDVRKPQGLDDGRPRATDDEGQLYSFEPAASLSVGIDLPAQGSVELLFINGHAGYEQMAAQIIAKYTGNPAPDDATLAAAFQKVRGLKQDGSAKDWPFAFSPEGDQLRLTEKTPRPWGHVLSNPLGYGVIVTNDGEIHSFAGNERQNALTPYTFEPVPSSMPGQIVYVVDIDRDELYSPGFVPLRREDTKQEVVYERGAVIFRSVAPDLDLELTLFVPPNQRADVRLLKVRNTSSVKRRFRIVPYFDLVCAETPGESAGRIEAAFDAKTDTMLFSNPTNGFYRGVGFVATNLKLTHREKIRARFIGAAGRDLAKPFMAATGLSDKHAGDDGRRVFAGTAVIEIDAGSEAEYVLVLGQEETKAAALATAQSLRDPKRAHQAL
ncbi:MAG TPA: glycosyl transferase family 36, partial [Methylovirgula sp.]